MITGAFICIHACLSICIQMFIFLLAYSYFMFPLRGLMLYRPAHYLILNTRSYAEISAT